MDKDDRIYVAGHKGLVGSALVRRLAGEYRNLIFRTHAELELTDQRAVDRFFEAESPDVVFLAAAKVGGILANNTYPAEFIYDNLAVQLNVLHAAWRAGVKRLLFLGSSCIYPRECPQPINEDYFMTGPLEPTNSAYALARSPESRCVPHTTGSTARGFCRSCQLISMALTTTTIYTTRTCCPH